MARADAYTESVKSPVKKYLSWSSNDRCLTYWDKEAKENKQVKLPLQLIHFAEFGTIKGWHDPSGSGIYSNEVSSSKSEELTVRSFKGKGELAKGLYQDIKEKVVALGGKYNLSLYALLNGEVVNISLQGSALQAWSKFATDSRKSFLGNFIDIKSAEELKKGSIKYSIPTFSVGGVIPLSVSESADKDYDTLVAYFKARTSNSHVEEVHAEEVQAVASAPVAAPIDDLPF
jgi:hypothetical protein